MKKILSILLLLALIFALPSCSLFSSDVFGSLFESDLFYITDISDYDNVDECHWNVGEGMLDWVAISRELKAKKQDLTVIIEVKHPAIPAHRTYKINPAFSILNIERNCMKLEYASEMQYLLERIRQSGFTG